MGAADAVAPDRSDPDRPESEIAEFRTLLLELVPDLRGFAYSLAGSAHRADDLVQETLVKAWANQTSFQRGTNMRAWLFTILRNEFYSLMRKRRREVEDVDGVFSAQLVAPAGQESSVEMEEMRQALAILPDDQREAIILIGASGLSYEEAAEVCGVAVGTVKSRVSRARTKLAELLDSKVED
ncbi:MAG: sigma-70 family RNA polymerase sigma factor [Hyphomicrobiales bacterium]|nr:sigma-70 family RNA polymerase sigma factor [Hyphomicrobiales bacterium]